MTVQDEFMIRLREALVEKLSVVDLDSVMLRYCTVEAVAEKMLASLPTVLITDPPVGACYTTRGLAVWRGVSRQAVSRKYRADRILGFSHDGIIVYPAVQFDDTGQSLPELRALLERTATPLTDAVQVSGWLQTPDTATGLTPTAALTTARITAFRSRTMLPEHTELTFVTPPE